MEDGLDTSGRHPHHGPPHVRSDGRHLAFVERGVCRADERHSESGLFPQPVQRRLARLARGDLAEEIDVLRHEPGGDIMVHGGATFVQALSQQRLIDEYRLIIRAVALGDGLQLFKD